MTVRNLRGATPRHAAPRTATARHAARRASGRAAVGGLTTMTALGLIWTGAPGAGAAPSTGTGDAAGTTVAASPVTPAAAAGKAEVPIAKNTYQPATLTVKLGDTVTWVNNDAEPHTVTTTSAPVAIDSGLFGKGETFAHTFTEPGTYQYYCAVHPEMVAEVIVLGADGKPVEGEQEDAAAQNPVAGLLKLLPKGKAEGGNHPAAHGNPAPDDPEDDPEDDPTSEHTPGQHGDNTPSGAPAGTGDNSTAPANSAYPWQPAVDPASGAVDPLMTHLEAAHFNRGAGSQVQDIAEFDSWAKSHLFLVRQMTEYFQGKDSLYGTTPGTSTFAKHMDNAHYTRSPMGQITDIAEFDSWNASHLALARAMADPAVGRDSLLGTAPAVGVFMQHLDAAHWNTSVNGQATAITDDFQGWLASHQALVEAMIADGSAK